MEYIWNDSRWGSFEAFVQHVENQTHLKRTQALVQQARSELLEERARIMDEMAQAGRSRPLASEQRTLDRVDEQDRQLVELARECVLEAEHFDSQRTRITTPGFDGTQFGAVAHGQLRSDSTYRPDRPDVSFFRDLVHASRGNSEAAERLARHQSETRAVATTGSSSAGGIIPPIYLSEMFAELARPDRPFADRVPSRPLPEAGMEVEVPKLTVGTIAGSQTAENQNLPEDDVEADTVAGTVNTLGGYTDASLQLLERSMPGLDQIVFNDLRAAYDAELDRQLLVGGGSNGEHLGIAAVTGTAGPVTYTSGTPTATELIPKLYQAISQVASARYRRADTIVMHPRRAAWLASGVAAETTLFQQTGFGAFGTQDGGFTSTFAGLTVVEDANAPTLLGSGTNEDAIFVVRADDLVLFESPPVVEVFRDILSQTGGVRLRLYAYSAFVSERQPKSICVIAGTGLSSPTFA